MVKRHVNLSFKYVRQGDLVTVARHIVKSMGSNADVFPKPPVPLVDVSKLIDVYSAALDAEKHASQTGEIRAARRALEAALKLLGQYVNDVADGDEVILEKSGFPLSKVPGPHGEIPAPTETGVELGDGGFIVWATIVDKSYSGVIVAATKADNPETNPQRWPLFQYSPVPDVFFTNGIEMEKKYKFAIAFVGSSEKLHWTTLGKTLIATW